MNVGDKDKDEGLWARVKKTVKPLKRRRQEAPPRADSAAQPANPGPRRSLPALSKTSNPDAKPRPAQRCAPLPLVARDKKIRRGRVQTQARIDLHGQTFDDARAHLLARLHHCQQQDRRSVLVITGRGTGDKGVLRIALPGWLEEADFAALVASFAPAHARHGGKGAWYVFLRRAK